MAKKIAVTGGKGGTGKSTFGVLLAGWLAGQGKKVVLVDCDVECPNDYLLTGQDLSRPVKEVTTEFPELIKERCQKCGRCAQVCRSKAIFIPPGRYPVFLPELCSGCGACWMVCPHQAIKAVESKIGEIFQNQLNDNLVLITGSARPVLEETSPVVSKLKEFSLDFSRKWAAEFIIFDTAAGTHCTVIEALEKSDFSYVVTEPTPLGNHDLKLILDLLGQLKIPAEVILNQADLGPNDLVEKIAGRYRSKLKLKIPYSREVAQAYSRGRLADFFQQDSGEFNDLFSKIKL